LFFFKCYLKMLFKKQIWHGQLTPCSIKMLFKNLQWPIAKTMLNLFSFFFWKSVTKNYIFRRKSRQLLTTSTKLHVLYTPKYLHSYRIYRAGQPCLFSDTAVARLHPEKSNSVHYLLLNISIFDNSFFLWWCLHRR
jgi:hypothetical protein